GGENPPAEHRRKEAATAMIEAAQGFYQHQWLLGTSGNLSVKTSLPHSPLDFLITLSGKHKGKLTPDDFVCVDAQGSPILSHQKTLKSSAETLLHSMIYQKFPQAGAVYHVHSPNATVLSMNASEDHLVFQGLEMLKGLGGDTHQQTVCLPIFENSQEIASLAKVIEPHLNESVPGFLLKGHGLYAWGKTPFEAHRHVEIWEFLFQVRILGG
ncbi:MAG: methylthioribulose 1-phosphate dehydratase, partial [Cyanobacteria bacterium]|nr:methylthioribulose 1-phosphate dehydratase [Cyanobacteriota bacterium]